MKKLVICLFLFTNLFLLLQLAVVGSNSLTKHRDSLNTLLDFVSDELKPRIYLQLPDLVLPADTNQAIAYAHSALKLADAHQLEPEQINSLNQLSSIFYYQGLVEKSLEHALQAIAILQTYSKGMPRAANLNILEGKCLFNKARAYTVLFADSVKVILDELTIAVEKLKNTKENATLAGAYKMLGMRYIEIDMIDEGLENCEKALMLYRHLGDKGAMALLYGRMSFEVDRVNSVEYIQNAIALFAEVNDSLGMAKYFISLAYVTRTILDAETNLTYLDQAYHIYEKHDNYQEMVYCLFHQSTYYFNLLEDPEAALKYLLLAAEICKKHQIIKRAGHVYISLGTIYRYMNDYTLANKYFHLADSITSFIPEGAERMRYFLELGIYYIELKKYEEAEKLMLEPYGLALKKKAVQLLHKTCFNLYLLYKEKGDFEQALFYFQKRKDLQDSILNKNTERAVAEMQIKFETEKKEHALQLMKKNEQLQNVQLMRRRNTIFAVSAGLLAVLALLALLARQYQNKRMAYAQLMKKNLELIKKDDKIKKDKSTLASNNQLDPEIHQQIIRKLQYQIKHNKIFLQADLSLNTLAKKCHTNSSYLSRAINAEYQSNFSGFINAMRIKEAQKMMADHSYAAYSVEGFSASVGFKTKSVFNAAFKKHTGVTPSFYLEYLQFSSTGSLTN